MEKQSLNRTMQYGNFKVYEHLNADEECLNRTMQYGNPFVSFEHISTLFV